MWKILKTKHMKVLISQREIFIIMLEALSQYSLKKKAITKATYSNLFNNETAIISLDNK